MKKIYLGITIILFIADRVIKYFASSINLGGGFVKIARYTNYSGAFSLPIAGLIYNIVGILLLLVFIYLFFREFKSKNNKKFFAYTLIVFGGLSNMFDRIYFDYVIDYIQLFNRSFFNIADIMLLMGVGILFIGQLKRGQVKEKL